MCVHQLSRRKGSSYVLPYTQREGVGDCNNCNPDKNNQYCAMYPPVKFWIIDTRKEQKDIDV